MLPTVYLYNNIRRIGNIVKIFVPKVNPSRFCAIRFFLLVSIVMSYLFLLSCGDIGSKGVKREVTAGECSDGKDNDGNGKIDCEDKNCTTYVFCDDTDSTTGTTSDSTTGSDSDSNTDGGVDSGAEADECNRDNAADMCGSAELCVDGFCCNTICDKACAACDIEGKEGICSPEIAGELCRESAYACDAEELCNGVDLECPADGVKTADEPCREVVGGCDAVEYCDGVNINFCPQDDILPAGAVCRAAASECDVEETCNGLSAECPEDTTGKPAGTACGSDNASICDNPDTCDSQGQCQENFEPSTKLCALSQGLCDPEEYCTGVSGDCPQDVLAAQGTVCREKAGTCDAAEEVCSGDSPACPADTFKSADKVCRFPKGPCDVAENCTGVSGDCPEDVLYTDAKECNPSEGDCDQPETCDGVSATCPPNELYASTHVCRPSQGVCDIAENCTGGIDCPADEKENTDVICRPVVDPYCDIAEYCTGGNTCPTNTWNTNTSQVCRANMGGCDSVETCPGDGPDCPEDKHNTQVLISTEPFSDTGIPSDWTDEDNWDLSLTDPPTGGTGGNAVVNKTTSNSNELLLTPYYDLPPYCTQISLTMDHDFNESSHSNCDDQAKIQVRSDVNSSWTPAQTFTSDNSGPVAVTGNQSGAASYQIQFNYLDDGPGFLQNCNGTDGHWKIDDVTITAFSPP